MLLLPIQMYGQQQGYGTADSNKILSEFGKSAYKMMMDSKNSNFGGKNVLDSSVGLNPSNRDLEMLQGRSSGSGADAFESNPYGFDLDPSGQFYIDPAGNPIDRDTYNYLWQDYQNQQREALEQVNPDNYNIGGILDYLQFYKR